MGVAPKQVIFGMKIVAVFIAHVNASNKSNGTIDDNDFTVIPIIKAVCQCIPDNFVKRDCLHAPILQFFQEGFPLATPKVIIHKAYLHPLLSLSY